MNPVRINYRGAKMMRKKQYIISLLTIVLLAVIVIAIQIFTGKIETIILYVLYDGITTILFANLVSFLTYCVLRRTELKIRDLFYIIFYSSINVLFVFLLWYYTMILYLFF